DHGAQRVFASDDPIFSDHLAQPAAFALSSLVAEHRPDIVMFTSSSGARDVAGRLQARTRSTLLANATDVVDLSHARTQMGDDVVDVELTGPPPHLVLVRPKSFAAQTVGGTAELVSVPSEIPDEPRRPRVVRRHEEA